MIARELVTKLSFTIDRTNLEKFEKVISGFKTKALVTGGILGKVVQQVIKLANETAGSVTNSKDIADYSNTALNDFKALQLVAEKFSIPKENFSEAFKEVAVGLREAERGYGAIFNLSRESFGLLDFKDQLGNLKTAEDFFLSLAEAIKKVPDVQSQLMILEKVPGIGAQHAADWLRLLEKSNEEILRLKNNEKAFADDFASRDEDAIRFRHEIARIGSEFTKIKETVGLITLPFLGKGLSGLNMLNEKSKETGLGSALDFAGQSIADAVYKYLGYETLEQAQQKVAEEDAYFFRKFQEQQVNKTSNVNSSNIINNKIEINVPSGTPEQQNSYMVDQVRFALDAFWGEKIREISNNNPQVE